MQTTNKWFIHIFILLILGIVSSKRNRDPINKPVSDLHSSYQSLMSEYKSLRENCQPSIVEHFDDWYPYWITKFLQGYQLAPPSDVYGVLNTEVDKHVETIKAYIDRFEKQRAFMKKLPITYFDIQMKDLMARISGIIGTQFTNHYDQPEHILSLEKSSNLHADRLVQSIADSELNVGTVLKVAEMFTNAYKDGTKTFDDLSPVVQELKDQVRELVLAIIELFASKSHQEKLALLDNESVKIVTEFFERFKWVVDPEEIRHKAFVALIGEPNANVHYEGSFFMPQTFNHLIEKKSSFTPFFLKDNFVTNYDPNFKLQDLSDAAKQPSHFNWELMDMFSEADAATFSFDKLKEERDKDSTPVKLERKRAKLYLVLYQVYNFARNDGTLQEGSDQDFIGILRKLYHWVLKTDEFNDKKFDEKDLSLKPNKGYQVLLPNGKFKHYFLSLLSLLCSKIPDCPKGLRAKEDKKEILHRFKANGNFEDLKENPLIDSLVEPELLKEIGVEMAKAKIADFAKELDNLVNDFPVITTPEIEDQMPKVEDPVNDKQVQPRKRSSYNDKLQKTFDEKVGDVFLGPTSRESDEQKKVHLKNFIDTIESTDNPQKKSVLHTLLIRFIYRLHGEHPEKAKPVIEDTLRYQLRKIRQSFDYKQIRGFDNFLHRTLTRLSQKTNFETRTFEQKLFHNLDFIVFVEMGFMDHYNTASKSGTDMTQLDIKKNTLSNVVKTKFYKSNGVPIEARAALRNDLRSKPFMIEKMVGLEFISHFFGFFDYFQVDSVADAQFVNYHSVFFNFYNFLNLIRGRLIYAPERPHHYLLEKMEQCLDYTDELQDWDQVDSLHPFCQMSHRKFAEMYFFFKLFLADQVKSGNFGIEDRQTMPFNTHTRMFLLFSSEYEPFRKALQSECDKTEGFEHKSVCMSWKVYNDMLQYLHTPELAQSYLEERISKTVDFTKTVHKLNLINGLEATFMNLVNSNMIDWSKIGNLFTTEIASKSTTFYQQMFFGPTDLPTLTRFLKRTFGKLHLDPKENNLAAIVQSILNGPRDADPSKDSLKSYMFHLDTFVPNYVKLFLQFAKNDIQFERIAALLIENGISYDLVRLNDINNDHFFDGVADSVRHLTKEAGLDWLRSQLMDKYDLIVQKCKQVTMNTMAIEVEDSDSFDMLDFLINEVGEEQEQKSIEEQMVFEEQVLPKLLQKDESDKHSVISLEEKPVIVKKVMYFVNPVKENTSVFDSKINMDSFDDEYEGFDESEMSFDFTTPRFENHLIETDLSKNKAMVGGIKIEDEIAPLVNKKSTLMIEELENKIARKSIEPLVRENALKRSTSVENRRGEFSDSRGRESVYFGRIGTSNLRNSSVNLLRNLKKENEGKGKSKNLIKTLRTRDDYDLRETKSRSNFLKRLKSPDSEVATSPRLKREIAPSRRSRERSPNEDTESMKHMTERKSEKRIPVQLYQKKKLI